MLQIVSYSHSDSSNNGNKAKYSVVSQRNQLWLGWGFRYPIFALCGLVYTVSHNIVSETILSTVNKANIFITIHIPQHLRGRSLTHPPSPQEWYGALSLIHECITVHTSGQRPFPPTTTPPYLIVHFMCIVGSDNIKYTVTVVSHICFAWISSTSEIEIIGKQRELLARPNTQWVWN